MNTNSTKTSRTPRRLLAGATAVAGLAMLAATAPSVAGSLVGSTDLAKGAVTTPKIAKKAVVTKKIADGAVKTKKLANDAVTADKLANGSVGRDQLASDVQPLWAFVWGGPTINKGKGAVSVAVEGVAGNYRVTFDRDISKCGYTATMASPDSTDPEQNGFINVSTFSADPKAVIVRTRDTAGVISAHGFTVQVWC
jgi:hypothetical protein